ncbi:hypothetical protein [Arthrobacter sp. H5]|nr:hypothetical protein [Arthrobacter sp. H5]
MDPTGRTIPLQRLDSTADPSLFQQLNRELMELETQRRALRSD